MPRRTEKRDNREYCSDGEVTRAGVSSLLGAHAGEGDQLPGKDNALAQEIGPNQPYQPQNDRSVSETLNSERSVPVTRSQETVEKSIDKRSNEDSHNAVAQMPSRYQLLFQGMSSMMERTLLSYGSMVQQAMMDINVELVRWATNSTQADLGPSGVSDERQNGAGLRHRARSRLCRTAEDGTSGSSEDSNSQHSSLSLRSSNRTMRRRQTVKLPPFMGRESWRVV